MKRTACVRGGGGPQQGVLVDALEGEAAEEGGADAVLRAGGAVVEVHGDEEQGDVDDDDGGDQPGEPFGVPDRRRRRRRPRSAAGGLVAPAGRDLDRSLGRGRRGDRIPSHRNCDGGRGQWMGAFAWVMRMGRRIVIFFACMDFELTTYLNLVVVDR